MILPESSGHWGRLGRRITPNKRRVLWRGAERVKADRTIARTIAVEPAFRAASRILAAAPSMLALNATLPSTNREFDPDDISGAAFAVTGLAKSATVFVEGTNLNNSTYSTHDRFENQVLDVWSYGRRFVFGARFRY